MLNSQYHIVSLHHHHNSAKILVVLVILMPICVYLVVFDKLLPKSKLWTSLKLLTSVVAEVGINFWWGTASDPTYFGLKSCV